MIIYVRLIGQFSHLVLFPLLAIFELLFAWCKDCVVCRFRWNLVWPIDQAVCTGEDEVLGLELLQSDLDKVCLGEKVISQIIIWQ